MTTESSNGQAPTRPKPSPRPREENEESVMALGHLFTRGTPVGWALAEAWNAGELTAASGEDGDDD